MPQYINGCELSEITPSVKNISDQNIFFGPTNFAHLSGSINGINKNIFLFSDTHLDLDNQTRCESFDSIDISQYLYKLIKNTTEPLDFFLEIKQSEINKSLSNKRDIYIKDVIEMFKTEFILEKDKVKYSKSNPNVRLHYLDIRDHLDMFYILHTIQYDINEIFNLIKKNIGNIKENINNISKHIKIIEYYLNKLYENKNDVIFLPQDIYKKEDKQKYYFDKVINKYVNNNLKNNITLFLNEHFLYIYNELSLSLKYVNEHLKYYEIKYKDETFINKFKENLQSMYDLSVDIYSLFVDVYLLRRILDKDYITNCIIYSGSQHSANYIYFLIKYCDFKLINIQRSIESDKNKLIKSIRDAKYAFEIYKLIYSNEKKYLQCIKKYTPFPREHRGGTIEYPDFDKVFH